MLKKGAVFTGIVLLALAVSGCGTAKGLGKGIACTAQGVGDGTVNLWRTVTKEQKIDGGLIKGTGDGIVSVGKGVAEDAQNTVNTVKNTANGVLKADDWFKENLW
jgi:predicted small secreted protein